MRDEHALIQLIRDAGADGPDTSPRIDDIVRHSHHRRTRSRRWTSLGAAAGVVLAVAAALTWHANLAAPRRAAQPQPRAGIATSPPAAPLAPAPIPRAYVTVVGRPASHDRLIARGTVGRPVTLHLIVHGRRALTINSLDVITGKPGSTGGASASHNSPPSFIDRPDNLIDRQRIYTGPLVPGMPLSCTFTFNQPGSFPVQTELTVSGNLAHHQRANHLTTAEDPGYIHISN